MCNVVKWSVEQSSGIFSAWLSSLHWTAVYWVCSLWVGYGTNCIIIPLLASPLWPYCTSSIQSPPPGGYILTKRGISPSLPQIPLPLPPPPLVPYSSLQQCTGTYSILQYCSVLYFDSWYIVLCSSSVSYFTGPALLFTLLCSALTSYSHDLQRTRAPLPHILWREEGGGRIPKQHTSINKKESFNSVLG